MTTTVSTVSYGEYIEIGTGPCFIEPKRSASSLRVHFGPTKPAVDTEAYHAVVDNGITYGKTEKVWARSDKGHNAQVVVS